MRSHFLERVLIVRIYNRKHLDSQLNANTHSDARVSIERVRIEKKSRFSNGDNLDSLVNANTFVETFPPFAVLI